MKQDGAALLLLVFVLILAMLGVYLYVSGSSRRAALAERGRGGGDDARMSRARQRLDLTSAMIRHHEAVDAERDSLFGIVRMHDSFHDQRPLPAIAIARNLLPAERALDLAPRELGNLGEARVCAHIGAQIGEARDAVA